LSEEDDSSLSSESESPDLLTLRESLFPGFTEQQARIDRLKQLLDQPPSEFAAALAALRENQKAGPDSTEHSSTEASLIESSSQSSTASAAQIAANRENSRLSTGPTSSQGKATVSQNRRSHGLTGRFTILGWENVEEFQSLVQSIYEEYKPETDSEQRLVDSSIQHYWLTQRAIHMQEQLIAQAGDPTAVDGKKLSLFLRYQTTHERSYYKAERELKNLRKQKRQEEIGFESQTHRQESQEARLRLLHARASSIEIDTAARQIMEAPLPGNTRLSFEELTKACSVAISNVVYQNQFKNQQTPAASQGAR
jgi:hypothetical protein